MIRILLQDPILHVIFPPSTGSSWEKRHSQFIYDQVHPEEVYQNPSLCKEVKQASARYEGENTFVGFNFPVTAIRPQDQILYSIIQQYPTLLYVIAYMKGDKNTIDHEKRHALYYCNPDYKKRVKRSWTKLKRSSPLTYVKIKNKLKRDGYQPKVYIDEFQAYYPNEIK